MSRLHQKQLRPKKTSKLQKYRASFSRPRRLVVKVILSSTLFLSKKKKRLFVTASCGNTDIVLLAPKLVPLLLSHTSTAQHRVIHPSSCTSAASRCPGNVEIKHCRYPHEHWCIATKPNTHMEPRVVVKEECQNVPCCVHARSVFRVRKGLEGD